MARKLILAFLIATPLGMALGFAARWLLSPHAAAGAMNLFVAFILLGTLGLVLAFRANHADVKSSALLPA